MLAQERVEEGPFRVAKVLGPLDEEERLAHINI